MGKDILLVDDDKITCKIVTSRLLKHGFNVTAVHNGKDCLEYLESHKGCLVLLDLVMPEMDGKEVLTEIRKKYSSFEVPVLILTADKKTSQTIECLNIGANDYLTKPFKLELAIARIKTQQNLVEFYYHSIEKRRIETINSMVVTYNHEINNPLTIALGSLKRDFDDLTPRKVEMAIKALNRISEIVRKIDQINSSQDDVEDCTYLNKTKMIKIA